VHIIELWMSKREAWENQLAAGIFRQRRQRFDDGSGSSTMLLLSTLSQRQQRCNDDGTIGPWLIGSNSVPSKKMDFAMLSNEVIVDRGGGTWKVFCYSKSRVHGQVFACS